MKPLANQTWLWLQEIVKITKELATNMVIWAIFDPCGYTVSNPRLISAGNFLSTLYLTSIKYQH